MFLGDKSAVQTPPSSPPKTAQQSSHPQQRAMGRRREPKVGVRRLVAARPRRHPKPQAHARGREAGAGGQRLTGRELERLDRPRAEAAGALHALHELLRGGRRHALPRHADDAAGLIWVGFRWWCWWWKRCELRVLRVAAHRVLRSAASAATTAPVLSQIDQALWLGKCPPAGVGALDEDDHASSHVARRGEPRGVGCTYVKLAQD